MMTTLLSPLLPYAVAAAALVAAVGWALLRARRAGREAERARQARETLASRERQDAAAARSPTDRAGLVERLRKHEF